MLSGYQRSRNWLRNSPFKGLSRKEPPCRANNRKEKSMATKKKAAKKKAAKKKAVKKAAVKHPKVEIVLDRQTGDPTGGDVPLDPTGKKHSAKFYWQVFPGPSPYPV